MPPAVPSTISTSASLSDRRPQTRSRCAWTHATPRARAARHEPGLEARRGTTTRRLLNPGPLKRLRFSANVPAAVATQVAMVSMFAAAPAFLRRPSGGARPRLRVYGRALPTRRHSRVRRRRGRVHGVRPSRSARRRRDRRQVWRPPKEQRRPPSSHGRSFRRLRGATPGNPGRRSQR